LAWYEILAVLDWHIPISEIANPSFSTAFACCEAEKLAKIASALAAAEMLYYLQVIAATKAHE